MVDIALNPVMMSIGMMKMIEDKLINTSELGKDDRFLLSVWGNVIIIDTLATLFGFNF